MLRQYEIETAQFLNWRTYEAATSRGPALIDRATICGRLDDGRYYLARVVHSPHIPGGGWHALIVDDAADTVWLSTYASAPTNEDLAKFMSSPLETRSPTVLQGQASISVCTQ